MATNANTTPIFQKNPLLAVLELTDADATVVTALVTAGTEGALIDNIAATSTDAVDIVMELFITAATVNYKIGEVTIPAGSGTDSTLASTNLFDADKLPFLQANGGLPLESGQTLSVACKTIMSAASECHLVAFGGDY